MTTFSRTDTSILGHWWWTVDRWTLAAIAALMAFGTILALASSPAVAVRIGVDELHFVKRHMALLPIAIMLIVGTSLLTPVQVRRVAIIGFAGCILALLLTLLIGPEIKGARRWIGVAGFSLQASEFVKPTFALVTAWLLSEQARDRRFPGTAIAVATFAVVIALVLAQPDLGQTVVITAVWLAQMFLAGIPLWLVFGGILAAIGGLAGTYLLLPHVTSRIDRFLDPSSGDTYQIDRSLEAFNNGGLLGRGPGEGVVKNYLPDAHADFVFAVAGEELGLIVSLAIVGLFAFIVLRGMGRALADHSLFALLAVSGLMTQFGLQALINMGSSLQMLPTKGMTLPFISYGGSSLLAIGLGLGMALALTRRRVGGGDAS
jgi:cell division protein FtsW